MRLLREWRERMSGAEVRWRGAAPGCWVDAMGLIHGGGDRWVRVWPRSSGAVTDGGAMAPLNGVVLGVVAAALIGPGLAFGGVTPDVRHMNDDLRWRAWICNHDDDFYVRVDGLWG